ncbi:MULTISPECIES: SAM-dependent methyltransferase [unclassified Streptomyces]|uniref:SAM-dependent methyltransferase n=1 Tax=unclassified Streptomyces TaxID=2593676 RepID=UPI000376BD71|nr:MULTISPECIES: SAM-dependent methyltransferase [unclassified Streptomyces]MYT32560.1 SAM-dependent methyltransferase [Streptomyces sp. SID8354]
MAVPEDWMGARPQEPIDLHTDRPHAARVYDVLLGGKTNYPADREAAEQTLVSLPNAATIARQNRGFMHRAARYLAGEAGIRQFLDIGTGIPTSPNLHEVVQAATPEARIVYADNDPIVLAHSRALHTSHPDGRTAYIQADLGRPQDILRDATLRDTLDLGQPVALTLIAVLHWLPAERDAYAVVRELMDAFAPGSYVAMTYATADFEPQALREITDNFESKGSHVRTRTRAEVLRFFDGLELVDPGLTVVHRWRPDPVEVGAGSLSDAELPLYAGLGRKS